MNEHLLHVWVASATKLFPEATRAGQRLPALRNTSRYKRLLAVLSQEEKRKLARFRAEDAALLYLIAHAMARLAIRRFEPDLPCHREFPTGALGKPRLDSPPSGRPLHWNLSHSWPLAAVVLTRRAQCGIDVEVSNTIAWREMAHMVLQPEEQRAVLSATDSELAFIRQWTLKEAAVKTMGLGLYWDPSTFRVCPARGIVTDSKGVGRSLALRSVPCALFGETSRGFLSVGCTAGRHQMPALVFHSFIPHKAPASVPPLMPSGKEISCTI